MREIRGGGRALRPARDRSERAAQDETPMEAMIREMKAANARRRQSLEEPPTPGTPKTPPTRGPGALHSQLNARGAEGPREFSQREARERATNEAMNNPLMRALNARRAAMAEPEREQDDGPDEWAEERPPAEPPTARMLLL